MKHCKDKISKILQEKDNCFRLGVPRTPKFGKNLHKTLELKLLNGSFNRVLRIDVVKSVKQGGAHSDSE